MPTTGAASASDVSPPRGWPSAQPTTAPLELTRRKPFPVPDEAIPAHDPVAPLRPVQPFWEGWAASPNAVAHRLEFNSQYPLPLGLAAIAPQPEVGASVLGG